MARIIIRRRTHLVSIIDGLPAVPAQRAELVAEFPVRTGSIIPTGMHFETVAFVTRAESRWFVDVYDRRARRSLERERAHFALYGSFEITPPADDCWREERDEQVLRDELVALMRGSE